MVDDDLWAGEYDTHGTRRTLSTGTDMENAADRLR
jgi:hypothetical protein